MEGTSDEAFHWKSRKGEGKMYGKVRRPEKILETSENAERKLRKIGKGDRRRRKNGKKNLAKKKKPNQNGWKDGISSNES
ncbi:hypothetical protein AKJ66_01880 [candidate division MSBL1 archaeon SCGC-AAA259E22]|uniref:Uncharacterized protein n=1 Tax=candidate division MSBL1 archaeon SCGC-AAA259E22 TaxID=1698265 RepID=A0A133UHE7_9EURY|nr:hypothetical protein AKJ66_01880 [candidate division MSBL1 archaeon SCGC-AAA259E22]